MAFSLEQGGPCPDQSDVPQKEIVNIVSTSDRRDYHRVMQKRMFVDGLKSKQIR